MLRRRAHRPRIGAARLSPARSLLLALNFIGESRREPDLGRLAQVLQGGVQLLHGGIDRIQSRPQGRLLSEVSLRGVDKGLIEAAQAMGCHRRDIVHHVLLLPEALPDLIAGFTRTVVAMIGSSAMAGAPPHALIFKRP